jgi:hypothetical protein
MIKYKIVSSVVARHDYFITVFWYKDSDAIHFTNRPMPFFPNPFDAYFWLMENVKGEIV